MCVLRFGFVLFWRAGYGFIDANVNLLFVLCNNLYDNFLKRSDNTRGFCRVPERVFQGAFWIILGLSAISTEKYYFRKIWIQ